MQADRPSAARRAPWRARVAARLRSERGDTLIEVIIAALMVALIATASLGGFSDITDITQSQRAEEQATALAQQDQGRLKGLTIAQLSASGTGTGNWMQPAVTVGGTGYTVTSSARFISGSTGSTACSGSTTSADIVETSSTVTWSGVQGQRTPVVLHGEITPTEGGSLVVPVDYDLNPTQGVAGVTISLTGPSTTTPVTTDSSGCAVFAGLENGTYTVSYTVPSGYITPSGAAPSSQTATVTTTQTQHVPPVYLGNAGLVTASFTTTLPTGVSMPSASDQFVLANEQANPTTQVFGTDSSPTNNVYQTALSTPQTIFPFDQSLGNNAAYTAYAGSCTSDDPTNPVPVPFYVTPGGITTPTLTTVPEPAMIINVTGNTFDDAPSSAVVYTGSHWVNQSGLTTGVYAGTVSNDATGGEYVSVTFTGTSIYWLGTYGPLQGIATVYLDGTNKGNVDMYSHSAKYQVVNSVTGLSNASHTLKILVSGTKDSNSNGYTISVDAFNAPSMTAPTLPSTIIPNVSVQDNGSGCGANVDYPPTVADTNTNTGVLQYPGEPWIANAAVCVDDGAYTATTTAVNDTTVHTSPAWTGVALTVALGAGATGVAAGTCP
jgi:type II secretory pathway pseudopilin PulG